MESGNPAGLGNPRRLRLAESRIERVIRRALAEVEAVVVLVPARGTEHGDRRRASRERLTLNFQRLTLEYLESGDIS